MAADPKPSARVVDRDVYRVARLKWDECGACRGAPGSVHHLIPRGEGGDDVIENLMLLCGTGTTGCHGAWHGNPYTVERHLPFGIRVERRDREWVARRIGATIRTDRYDFLLYASVKLGVEPGRSYLNRVYYLEA